MPSDIEMQVDMADFGKQIARLAAASRRTNREVVEQQARLIVVDLIKSTPPTGNRPLYEGWSFQKRRGQACIDRDFGRLYQPLSSINAVIAPASISPKSRNVRRNALRKMAERGDWHGLTEALFAMKVTDERVPVQATLSMEEYRATRKLFASGGGRGQVPARRARRLLVWDSKALTAVKQTLKDRVGWAKAGWMAAARKLKATRIPQWIANHPSPGNFIDGLRDGDYPSFTIINSVGYIDYLNKGNRLLVRMLRNRERAMEISIEHALEHFIEEFNEA